MCFWPCGLSNELAESTASERHMTIHRIDAVWAAFFGLSPPAFLRPGIQVVAHHRLARYQGAWLFRYHASLCLSLPPGLVESCADRRASAHDGASSRLRRAATVSSGASSRSVCPLPGGSGGPAPAGRRLRGQPGWVIRLQAIEAMSSTPDTLVHEMIAIR
jgi:hypothetical protein